MKRNAISDLALNLRRLLRDLAKAHKVLSQTIYYTTQPGIERGTVYIATKTNFTPQCIICHDEDLKKIEAGLGRPLTHLRDWKPKVLTNTGTTTKDILDLFEESLREIRESEPAP